MEQTDSDDTELADNSDAAAEAFTRLEGQVALMRRAVEQLAAERADIVIPDYGATLGEMAVQLCKTSEALTIIAGKPAMRLTPETLAERIEAAAETARCTDREQLANARRRFDQRAEDMRALAGRVRAAAEQRRRLFQAAGGGLLAGIVLWSFLPGLIARSAPASWHWPESMATQMLSESSPWDAGTRLIRAGNPEGWQLLTEAAELLRDNREAIAGCRKEAKRLVKAVRCAVDVEPEGAR